MTNQELIGFALRFLSSNLDSEVYSTMMKIDLDDCVAEVTEKTMERSLVQMERRLKALAETIEESFAQIIDFADALKEE